ncbi:MAG: BTAD domain-containing putative transcriptional regulator, partial [Pseudomonadota bacterium]
MADKLRITLLGGFQARLGDGPALALKGRKAQALLALLALSGGTPLTREKLTGLLWSERGEEQARGSLRQALAELRRALGEGDTHYLGADRDSLSLNGANFRCDALDLEALVASGELERACALYGGPLLDGISVADPAFEDWLAAERARFAELAQGALNRLLARQTGAGDSAAAVATARKLLDLDPLQEPVHRALMSLYADQGERAMALKQYRTCRDLLANELGVEPEAETTALFEALKSGTAAPTAPAPGPVSDDVSIAVLPFANLSGDPEQEYFSDGITEDIITELSRFRELMVIARNSSFAYKDKAIKVQDIGRDLGACYLLEGSVRKAGKRVRVSAQLVETASGNHLWAERYDRELEDIFAVQDEITQAIVTVLPTRLQSALHETARRKPTENLSAYDCVLRGRWLHGQTSGQDRTALTWFERAIELDPCCAKAYVGLANSYAYSLFSLNPIGPDPALSAREKIEQALAITDDDYDLHTVASEVYLMCGEHHLAMRHSDRALALNPNFVNAMVSRGFLEAYTGKPALGADILVKAFALD